MLDLLSRGWLVDEQLQMRYLVCPYLFGLLFNLSMDDLLACCVSILFSSLFLVQN